MTDTGAIGTPGEFHSTWDNLAAAAPLSLTTLSTARTNMMKRMGKVGKWARLAVTLQKLRRRK